MSMSMSIFEEPFVRESVKFYEYLEENQILHKINDDIGKKFRSHLKWCMKDFKASLIVSQSETYAEFGIHSHEIGRYIEKCIETMTLSLNDVSVSAKFIQVIRKSFKIIYFLISSFIDDDKMVTLMENFAKYVRAMDSDTRYHVMIDYGDRLMSSSDSYPILTDLMDEVEKLYVYSEYEYNEQIKPRRIKADEIMMQLIKEEEDEKNKKSKKKNKKKKKKKTCLRPKIDTDSESDTDEVFEEVECIVCMDEISQHIYLPCKHKICCFKCVEKVTSCPICAH